MSFFVFLSNVLYCMFLIRFDNYSNSFCLYSKRICNKKQECNEYFPREWVVLYAYHLWFIFLAPIRVTFSSFSVFVLSMHWSSFIEMISILASESSSDLGMAKLPLCISHILWASANLHFSGKITYCFWLTQKGVASWISFIKTLLSLQLDCSQATIFPFCSFLHKAIPTISESVKVWFQILLSFLTFWRADFFLFLELR